MTIRKIFKMYVIPFESYDNFRPKVGLRLFCTYVIIHGILIFHLVVFKQMFAGHLGANTGPNLAMITQTRTIVDAHIAEFGEDAAYMYGFPFLFFEQYLHSNRDLYVVVGLALGNCHTLNLLKFCLILKWPTCGLNATTTSRNILCLEIQGIKSVHLSVEAVR